MSPQEAEVVANRPDCPTPVHHLEMALRHAVTAAAHVPIKSLRLITPAIARRHLRHCPSRVSSWPHAILKPLPCPAPSPHVFTSHLVVLAFPDARVDLPGRAHRSPCRRQERGGTKAVVWLPLPLPKRRSAQGSRAPCFPLTIFGEHESDNNEGMKQGPTSITSESAKAERGSDKKRKTRRSQKG